MSSGQEPGFECGDTDRSEPIVAAGHMLCVPIKPTGQCQLLLALRSHVLSQTVNLLLSVSADTVSDTRNSSCLCGRVA